MSTIYDDVARDARDDYRHDPRPFERTVAWVPATPPCPLCGKPELHGQFYAAGHWGYTCDFFNQARDHGTSFRRVHNIENLPPDIQARIDDGEAAYQARQTAKAQELLDEFAEMGEHLESLDRNDRERTWQNQPRREDLA